MNEPTTDMNSDKVEVRVARDDSERKLFYEIEQAEYGADSIVSFEDVLGWWKRFPRGGYRLVKDGEILGGTGLWPLTLSAFEELKAGRLDEGEMTAECIQSLASNEPLRYWYFADIILRKQFRQSRNNWAGVLLEGATRLWLEEPGLSPEIAICALVYSPQGKILARRLGFEMWANSPQGYEVYGRTVTPLNFYQDIKAMSERRRLRSPSTSTIGMDKE